MLMPAERQTCIVGICVRKGVCVCVCAGMHVHVCGHVRTPVAAYLQTHMHTACG